MNIRTILITAIVPLITFPVTNNEHIRSSIQNKSGWKETESGPNSMGFRRTSDQASLFAYARIVHENHDLGNVWDGYVKGGARTRTDASVGEPIAESKLPLGDRTRYVAGERSTRLEVLSGRFLVTILVSYQGKGPKGNVTWDVRNRDSDRLAVEGFVRHIVALQEGEMSRPGGHVAIRGRNVAKRIGREGTVMVALAQWCTAQGIALIVNQDSGTATFADQAGQCIFALGSRELKRGSQWVGFAGTLFAHEGDWFVPLELLDSP